MNAVNAESLGKLFLSYPYKKYQLAVQKIQPETIAAYYANRALRASCIKYTAGEDKSLSAVITIEKSHTLSQSFGFPIAFVTNFICSDTQNYHAILSSAKDILDGYFLICRQPADNTAAVNALQKCGFYYVCTETVYTLDLDTQPQYSNDNFSRIRPCTEDDLDKVRTIAENEHTDIRFYFDPYFPREKTARFFSETIVRSFNNPSHRVFVYDGDNGPAGFITSIHNKGLSEICGRGYGSLDYIAVDRSYQKTHAGYALNNYALEDLRRGGCSVVSVKTMGSNYRAMRLLQKNKFIPTSHNIILHRTHTFDCG